MECTIDNGENRPISQRYLEMIEREKPTEREKAVALWTVCEKDQSTENVLYWCEIYDIPYAKAMEWKDYCDALNAMDRPLKSRK